MKKDAKIRIIFSGGGTGGHIFPIIAISREIKKMCSEAEFFYLGPRDPFSAILLEKEGIKCYFILAGKIRRYFSPFSFFQNFFDLFFKTPIGIFQSLFLIFSLKAKVIFSKGGFGAFPVVVAGKILRKKVILHESDVVMGLANRICAKFSDLILISFPETKGIPSKKEILYVGHPIRGELLEKVDKKEVEKEFGITGEKPVILVLGGSQGAERINEKILQNLIEFLEDFEILHQTGKKNFDYVKNFANHVFEERKKLKKYYHPFPFFDETQLKKAFSVSDFVISRAGAGTIAEILAFELPSILIPLPESAQNHQLENAYFLEKRGAAILILEENFSPKLVKSEIKKILSKPSKLDEMKERIREIKKTEGAKEIAKILLSFFERRF